MSKNRERRKGIVIMGRMIGLVKPLIPVMGLAILLGVAGFFCAIFLTILATYGLVDTLMKISEAGLLSESGGIFLAGRPKTLASLLLVMAVSRGLLHYGEQYCNHYIAFKLLAIIRHKVFAALRRLSPAKLEGRDKGNLIAIITSDIELLEVFYAHTISPIAIAILICLVMVSFIGYQNLIGGLIALAAYLVVGVGIPLWNGRQGASEGMAFRDAFGDLNSLILDSLRGLDETIQYGRGSEQKARILDRSADLAAMQKKLNRHEAAQRSLTNTAILLFSLAMLVFTLFAYKRGQMNFLQMMVSTVAMMGSFGPVVALSNLSNHLNQTLASGERVLSLLEEEPVIEEVTGRADIAFEGAKVEGVDFAYDQDMILKDCSLTLPKGRVVGIHGPSGCGKSTLLKLLMRFWDADKGDIKISRVNVKEINTKNLRDMESYVTQETQLFHDSIANNIEIGRLGATREDIVAAAQKASIHDFIISLPKGYDTLVGELGDTLSGGERQRIGLARAFLHDAPFLLLDEPTSNLDALNEGIILKSLEAVSREKTLVLVTHRKSTMKLADWIYTMAEGQIHKVKP